MTRETPTQAAERRLLGAGLSFPLRRNASGYMATSTGRHLVREAVEQVIMTDPRERPYRVRNNRGYGTRLRSLMFENPDVADKIGVPEVKRALATWEPRIIVQSVTIEQAAAEGKASSNGEGTGLVVTVGYLIKSTGDVDFAVVRISSEARP